MTGNETVQASEMTASIPEGTPETIKAAVLRDHEVGLQIETLRTPQPKAGEVLIKMTACGLYHSDLHVIGGATASPPPAVLGHEVSGTIVELDPGNEHTGLAVGQEMAGGFLIPCGQCDACVLGRDGLCGPFFNLNRLKNILYDGTTRLTILDGEPVAMYSMSGLTEYAVVPSTAMTPVPSTIDMVPATILDCTAMTGYGAVRCGAGLRYGETVAVVTIEGVGINIVQITRTFGTNQVITIDVDDEKLAPMLDYGATVVVNSVTQDAREKVFRLTSGKGVDVSSGALGIPVTWTTTLGALTDGGRMVPIGLGAGVQTAGVEINHTVRRSQSILGSYGTHTRQGLSAVTGLADKGVINYRDIVPHRLPLEETGAGYTALRNREIQGRTVIDMSL